MISILYISGYGRSGTTALEAYLSAHESALSVGEAVNLDRPELLRDTCTCGAARAAYDVTVVDPAAVRGAWRITVDAEDGTVLEVQNQVVPGIDGSVDEPAHLALYRDVRLTGRQPVLRRQGCQRIRVDVTHVDAGTTGKEPLRDREADAAGGTGDERAPADQRAHRQGRSMTMVSQVPTRSTVSSTLVPSS